MSAQALPAAAAALRAAAVALTDAGARVGSHDPGPSSFGVDGPGELGELGRALYRQWQRALDARGREAASHGVRLDQAAEAVARAAVEYAEIDHAAHRRLPEVL
jgi:hypothetical protein